MFWKPMELQVIRNRLAQPELRNEFRSPRPLQASLSNQAGKFPYKRYRQAYSYPKQIEEIGGPDQHVPKTPERSK